MGGRYRYNSEKAEVILHRLSEGDSLVDVCRDLKISMSCADDWRRSNEDFAARYARARELQGHVAAERALEAAVNAKDAQLDRLKFDALRWFAGKVAPRHYGDKVTTEHTGPDGGAPVVIIRRLVEKDGDG